jgi:hypothetical protein
MANARDKNKKMIGGYVDKELKASLRLAAKSEGKTQKDLIEEFVMEGIKRRLHSKRRR